MATPEGNSTRLSCLGDRLLLIHPYQPHADMNVKRDAAEANWRGNTCAKPSWLVLVVFYISFRSKTARTDLLASLSLFLSFLFFCLQLLVHPKGSFCKILIKNTHTHTHQIQR